jgi:polyisoprenoid-binding protein YceI
MIRRIAFAVCFALTCSPLYAATYTLEPDYTQGNLRWNHLGFSTPTAQFSGGQGTLEFDPATPTKASVSVEIPLASLKTGVPDLDEDFQSKSFFETAKYPIATFKSTKVRTGDMPGRLQVSGELNLHGVTKPLTLEVTVLKVGTNPRTNLPTVGFSATATLMRSDFGLGRFVPQVADEIQLQITTQGADAKAYAEYLKQQAAKK